jgi:hypothetical protein
MSKRFVVLFACWLIFGSAHAQVDSSYIYNQSTPYGTLDIRLAKSATRYYYLQENVTFGFRESAPGVRTNTYKDMTSWDSSPYSEGNLREKSGDADNFVMNYRLLKPVNYNKDYPKGYPLIILFHGSGEKGNCWNNKCFWSNKDYDPNVNNPPAPTDPEHGLLNNDGNLIHGGQVYLNAVNLAAGKMPNDPTLDLRAFPGFILIPQNLNGWTGDAVQDALRILRLVEKKYNIDKNRVFVNGLSNGAHGAFEAMKRAPWLFTSAIMMSAVDDGFITSVGLESTVARIPLWIFQGELDHTPYPAKTKMYMKRFRNAGAVIRYTEYAGIGHTTWNRAFKDPEFFSWMLGANMNSIHVFAGHAAICNKPGSALPLQLPAGFLAYQWEKDGKIISGANGYLYPANSPGKYRARFSRLSTTPSEGQWNEWSPVVNVTTQNPPSASINQFGTVMLTDLNSGNTAYLESTAEFAHYYWYKNGALVDFPGNEDDTLKFVAINKGNCAPGCSGNGSYTLVTSNYDNCTSAPSVAKNIFFSNQAPVKIGAPSNFVSENPTASTVNLKWKDNSADEIGFEIWRRKKTASGFEPWLMTALTSAGAIAFQDSHLLPQAVYQYKIRAVSSSARSDYSPSAANTGIEVITGKDTTPPAAPPDVEVERIGVDRVIIHWQWAPDDTGIRAYRVSFDGKTVSVAGTDSTLLVSDLSLDKKYDFSLKAIDLSGNESADSRVVHVLMSIAGLFYDHSPGYWPSLDSIDFDHPEYRGTVENFTLKQKVQEDYFYFRFDGFVYITKPGSYKFRTSSDDGSRLRINKKLIVENNGIHRMRTVQGAAQTLNKGPNRITVDFFEYDQSDSLLVEYSGPDTDNKWAKIPADALRGNVVVATEPAIENTEKFHVFPNPADQQNINVQFQTQSRSKVSMAIIDPVGKIIYRREFDPNEISEGVKVTPEVRLPGGLYIVMLNQGSVKLQQKLLITE